MPSRWIHREFIEQLVYDLLFPEKTNELVNRLSEMFEEKFSRAVRSKRSLSSVWTDIEPLCKEWDFTCLHSIKGYLDNVKVNVNANDNDDDNGNDNDNHDVRPASKKQIVSNS